MQTKVKNRVGLDIGTHTVKILEFSDGQDKTTLTGIGLKKISGLSKEETSKAIKTLAEESRINSKEVNISVYGASVIVRFVSMPKMTKEELEGAVRFEAEKFIPFNINDCIIDFQILKKDPKENKMDILLVAAKKESVMDKIKLVESAGFTVNKVDVDSFAMANAFLRNKTKPEQDKSSCVLDIGASITKLSIISNSSISFSRDIAIAGNDINAAISKRLGIELAMSEDVKITPGDKLQDVTACAKIVLGNLLDEVRLSFSYYENQNGHGIDEIYVSGGVINVPAFEEIFMETLGSKPLFWNPLQFLDLGSLGGSKSLAESMKNYFAIAAGLALR